MATNNSVNTDTTFPVNRGGTGQTTYTDGQLLIGNSTGNTLSKSTLTGSSGVDVANGSGTITLSKSQDSIGILVEAGDTALGTGDAKNGNFITIPIGMNGWNLTQVIASVFTAGTTGTTDVQIRNVTDSVDMLSTKITIDSGETSFATAATPPVIDTNNDDVATGDVLTIDVDAVHTTPPDGLAVVLTFEKGKVVEGKAKKGQDLLEKILKIPGAKRVGELAFATNYNMKRFVKNMLFDEKIGGTIHMALGNGWPETGSKNRSAIHWDCLCDMREEGQIFADGNIIYEKGKFLI